VIEAFAVFPLRYHKAAVANFDFSLH